MSDIISVTGTVATDPRHVITSAGVKITTFRLASSQRRFDRAEGKWVEAPTNWYTVSAFSALAVNAAASLRKGERVVARGRLQVRDWESETRSGTTVEVVAESIGHDLLWGTTTFTRAGAPSGRAGEAPVGDADAPSNRDADGWAVPGTGVDDVGDQSERTPELSDVPF